MANLGNFKKTGMENPVHPPKQIRPWIMAMRPWSFPASAMPALIAMTYVFYAKGNIPPAGWINGILAVLGAVLFQSAGNLIGDYYDFKYQVDRKETLGSNRFIVDRIFAPKTILHFGWLLLIAGSVIGIFLLFRSGIALLFIGLAGILGTCFYYFLKYRSLGDLDIFIIYGQLVALGTAYVMTKQLDIRVLAVSVPVGLLIVDILHANNTRDILSDGKARIRTFAMLIGFEASKKIYAFWIGCCYLSVVLLVCLDILSPLCLLVLLVLPLAVKNIRWMQSAGTDRLEKIEGLDGASAQLVLIFSILLCMGNVIAKIF